ncbi:MAG: argininosuccinate synthase [Chloroflexi bacterium]|nr:argininosuccinate synthase [Chloroflexota bacterium]MBT3862943.1 argininosuccinate synthase [Chloroflexota bacterium]MBT4142939.1 argininosuccinate synthase [Chloroflexota bacterium]MBT4342380.1 argininosuccinate synthase [Chloroflexota bacterium]MBT4944093.1 argininosuccinate synthase [Chloroflexota bacterium]
MAREKCVLAYSGGMDSTISTVWIQENYNMDVVTLTVDLGAGPEIVGVKERAAQAGAIQSLVWDVRDEFVNEYVFPGLKAGAMYEGVYALSTALGRPLMAKKLVEAAREVGATAVAHGCTGKGNDQVRFDSGIMTLSAAGEPLKIVAPAREWGMTRDEEKLYAQKAGLELREVGSDQRVYSIDRNLWGQAIEGEDLEDTWLAPPEDAFSWVKQISDTPDEGIEVVVGFEKGVPVSLDGSLKGGVELIAILNDMAGEHGVGRIDHVENRLVGIKSREVYETPAAIVLHTALKALETSTMSREQQRVKDNLSAIYSDLVYDGRWFTELRTNIAAFMDSAHQFSTGDVRLRLHKGTCLVVGRRSPFSLYDFDLATYSTTDSFDHEAATGFIDIYSLSARTQSRKQTNSEQR